MTIVVITFLWMENCEYSSEKLNFVCICSHKLDFPGGTVGLSITQILFLSSMS